MVMHTIASGYLLRTEELCNVQAIESYTFVAADGVLMPLEEGTSAFITMNPGYIGRAELPESLKVCHFRLHPMRSLLQCCHFALLHK